jgi:1-acyl-sn-glycerol-3-phosphate acyltransferase
MLKKNLRKVWLEFCHLVCVIFCGIFFKIRVYGAENVPVEGPAVLVSNHQSFLDPVFCGVPLKRYLYYMARDSLFSDRFFGWLIWSLNTVPVRRDEADFSAVRALLAELKRGNPVCLFPEGTRTPDGRVRPFKPGFGLLVRRGSAALVPVVVEGAFECWPRHRLVPRPGTVAVCYGKPLEAGELKGIGDKELASVLTQVVRRMQNECRERLGRRPYDYGDR